MNFDVYKAIVVSLSDNAQELGIDGYLPRLCNALYAALDGRVTLDMGRAAEDAQRCSDCAGGGAE